MDVYVLYNTFTVESSFPYFALSPIQISRFFWHDEFSGAHLIIPRFKSCLWVQYFNPKISNGANIYFDLPRVEKILAGGPGRCEACEAVKDGCFVTVLFPKWQPNAEYIDQNRNYWQLTFTAVDIDRTSPSRRYSGKLAMTTLDDKFSQAVCDEASDMTDVTRFNLSVILGLDRIWTGKMDKFSEE